MDKRFIASVSLIAVFGSVALAAPPMQQGSYELRAGTTIDVADRSDEHHLPVEGALGYYVADGLQIGGSIGYERKGWASYWGVDGLWSLGVFGEYNFMAGETLVPFAGLGVAMLDAGDPDDELAVVTTLSGGTKLFLTPTIALSAQLNYSMGSEDVFDFDRADDASGSGESSDVTVSIAARFFY